MSSSQRSRDRGLTLTGVLPSFAGGEGRRNIICAVEEDC
jgi:hypothetical protein